MVRSMRKESHSHGDRQLIDLSCSDTGVAAWPKLTRFPCFHPEDISLLQLLFCWDLDGTVDPFLLTASTFTSSRSYSKLC